MCSGSSESRSSPRRSSASQWQRRPAVHAPHPPPVAQKVVGGLTGTEHDGEMFGDDLVGMTTDGEVIWDWRSWEHLHPEADAIAHAGEHRSEWTHGNTVAEMPNGNFLVSFRNISTVAVVDRTTGVIVWKLGPPTLAQQHAPVLLDNDHLLIFRQRHLQGRSSRSFLAGDRGRSLHQRDRVVLSSR